MFEYRVLFRAKDSGYYRPVNIEAESPVDALQKALDKMHGYEHFASLEFMGKANG